MVKKYIVRLTEEERLQLEKLAFTGKVAAYKRQHAAILLKADVNAPGGGCQDRTIGEALSVSVRTVERVRERFVEKGLEAALNRAAPTRVRSRVIDGEAEAHLIALSCGEPPEGRCRWTLRLLGQTLVELGYVESVSYETVRQTLKKRPETLAKQGMVHPSGTQRGIRLCDGGHA
jgi:transposase